MLHADKYKHYVQSLQTAVIVPQSTRSQTSLSTSEAGEAYSSNRGRGGPHRGGRPFQSNWPQSRQDYKHSIAPMCEYCGRAPHNSRQECRALGMECYTCHKFGHLSHMCRQNTESNKTEVKHIDTEEESQDCLQSEYTTPFYTTNNQAKASVKCLKTTTKLHYMKNRDNEHIRPL